MKKGDQIAVAVVGWQASGLTQKAYCEKTGLKPAIFANWVRGSKDNSAKGFIALTPPVGVVSEAIELTYPNGVRLKVTPDHLPVLSDLIHLW